jgi:hypothetical protein
MLRVNKRGQDSIGISYGLIFSIILIVAIIGVAYYAISHFLCINSCSQRGFFYSDFQEEINKAWTSDGYDDMFNSSLPSGIEKICLGNLTQACDPAFCTQRDEIKRTYNSGGKANVFMYPQKDSCGCGISSNVLQHVDVEKFFCVDVNKGKVGIKLKKPSPANVNLVRLEK